MLFFYREGFKKMVLFFLQRYVLKNCAIFLQRCMCFKNYAVFFREGSFEKKMVLSFYRRFKKNCDTVHACTE